MIGGGKSGIGFGDIALVIASAVFLAGVLTVFGACDPMEDGSWMSCHWANMAVAGMAAALLAVSVAHLFVRDARVKVGMDMAILPLAVVAAVTPGFLINLCMMATMHCNAVMRPAVIAMSVLVVAAAVVDLVRQRAVLRSA